MKPMFIFRQGKIIFKQYAFSKKINFVPDESTPLVSNDEWCGVVVSSFASREFWYVIEELAQQQFIL